MCEECDALTDRGGHKSVAMAGSWDSGLIHWVETGGPSLPFSQRTNDSQNTFIKGHASLFFRHHQRYLSQISLLASLDTLSNFSLYKNQKQPILRDSNQFSLYLTFRPN